MVLMSRAPVSPALAEIDIDPGLSKAAVAAPGAGGLSAGPGEPRSGKPPRHPGLYWYAFSVIERACPLAWPSHAQVPILFRGQPALQHIAERASRFGLAASSRPVASEGIKLAHPAPRAAAPSPSAPARGLTYHHRCRHRLSSKGGCWVVGA